MQPDHVPKLKLKMLKSFSSRPSPSLVTSTKASRPSLQILLLPRPHVRPSLQTRIRSTCSSISTSVNHVPLFVPGKSCLPCSSSQLLTPSFPASHCDRHATLQRNSLFFIHCEETKKSRPMRHSPVCSDSMLGLPLYVLNEA